MGQVKVENCVGVTVVLTASVDAEYNDKTARVNHMLGTDKDFILTNYNKEENLNEAKS